MKRSGLALVLIVGGLHAVRAQSGASVTPAISRALHSAVLGEQRAIDVSLPAGYAADTAARYPVIYVLDGEFEGELARAIIEFYGASSIIPPAIVVAVRNTDRQRDMTPTAAPGFDPPSGHSGGATTFLDFFEKELIPYVDRAYRTSPMRALVGHSLGGLFVMHALAQKPTLFTGYVAMEPAVWWNNQQPLREVAEVLRQPVASHVRLMLVNGRVPDLDTSSFGGSRPMIRGLTVSGETHESMAAQGMLLGLRTLFEDFRPSVWRPGSRPIEMIDNYDSLGARLGYAVTLPREAFELAFRMSINSRWFDDAQRIIDRMERESGPSRETGDLRQQLREERSRPAPPDFVPLVMAANRPSAVAATRFLGRWELADPSMHHSVEILARGDSIVVHDRFHLPGSGDYYDKDDPVIGLRRDGTLEWGLTVFHGLAALLVLKANIEPDGTMVVTREVRGWSVIGPGPDVSRVERFRRSDSPRDN